MTKALRWTMAAHLALALAAAPVWARGTGKGQPPEGDAPGQEGMEERHGEMFLEMLNQKLDLTEEQSSKIKAIVDQSKPKMQEIQKRMKELMEQQRKLHREQSEKIRALLNEEQKEKYDELKAKMRKRMVGPKRHGGRWKPGMTPGGPDEGGAGEEGQQGPHGWHGPRGRFQPARPPGDDLPPPEMMGEPGGEER